MVLRAFPVLLAAGAISTAVLAAGVSGSLSGFSAVISGPNGTSTLGTVVLNATGSDGTSCLSTDGGSVATNSAVCTTINAFAADAPLVPGTSTTSTVVLKNVGTTGAGGLQLAAGACTQSGAVAGSASDLCSKLTISVSTTRAGTTTQVYSGALGGLATQQLGSVAAAGETGVRFELSLPTGTGNAYQGLIASVPITWTLSA